MLSEWYSIVHEPVDIFREHHQTGRHEETQGLQNCNKINLTIENDAHFGA